MGEFDSETDQLRNARVGERRVH